MEQKVFTLNQENFEPFLASQQQLKYFQESTYDIITPGGNCYRRYLELIAFSKLTGNVLVREKVTYNKAQYEKVYIVSKEGKSEKYMIV